MEPSFALCETSCFKHHGRRVFERCYWYSINSWRTEINEDLLSKCQPTPQQVLLVLILWEEFFRELLTSKNRLFLFSKTIMRFLHLQMWIELSRDSRTTWANTRAMTSLQNFLRISELTKICQTNGRFASYIQSKEGDRRLQEISRHYPAFCRL